MENLKSTSVYIAPGVHRAVKTHAARFGVRFGDAVAAMLSMFETLPLETQVRAMAAYDSTAGALVEDGTEAEHVAHERALAAVPDRIDGEDF